MYLMMYAYAYIHKYFSMVHISEVSDSNVIRYGKEDIGIFYCKVPILHMK